MTQTQTDSIRFECTTQEKDLANAISQRRGRVGVSALMRQLIYEEAERLELKLPTPDAADYLAAQ